MHCDISRGLYHTCHLLLFIEQWRHRLYDISWFMRNLNETIARRANEEDDCAGRFWEGRFKSQAIPDDAALLACMSYVDLNPIRAGIVDTPVNSDFTSIQECIRHYHKILSQTGNRAEALISTPNMLLPLIGGEHKDKKQGLNFSLIDYLELADWTGRAMRDNKTGSIPEQLEPILERLYIEPEVWLDSVQNYSNNYYTVVGTREAIRDYSAALGRKWFCLPGLSSQLYQVAATR